MPNQTPQLCGERRHDDGDDDDDDDHAAAVTGRATTSGSVEQAGSAHRGVHRRGGCLTWTEQREMGESLNVEGSIMSLHSLLGRSASITVAVTLALLAWVPPAQARITRIVIDNTASATITRKIDWTTLRVVWRPTLSAPPWVRNP